MRQAAKEVEATAGTAGEGAAMLRRAHAASRLGALTKNIADLEALVSGGQQRAGGTAGSA